MVNSIRDYHNIIFQLSLVNGWSAFCKSYLICKTFNEKCKVSCRSSCGNSKLALPPGEPGTRLPTEMFIPGLFWHLLLFLALREQLHDFISALYAFVSTAGLIVEPMSGCFLQGYLAIWLCGCLIKDRDFLLLFYALEGHPTHRPHWHVKLVKLGNMHLLSAELA